MCVCLGGMFIKGKEKLTKMVLQCKELGLKGSTLSLFSYIIQFSYSISSLDYFYLTNMMDDSKHDFNINKFVAQ